MPGKTAVIFGGTGLTGSYLLEKMIEDPYWTSIQIFLRQALPITSPKVDQHVTNFNKLSSYAHLIKGDVLFICLGTTLRSAGSPKEFLKIDLELPKQLSQYAVQNGMKKMLFISSIGADAESSNFYLKTKGKAELELSRIGFESYYFLRPSILLGKRKQKRPAEFFAKGMMRLFKFALVGKFRKYRGIEAEHVAEVMIWIAKNDYPSSIIESEDIREIIKT